jgi:hypothetical protein
MTEEVNPHDEEKQAIDRIARTHDGRLLHRYFRRILETCSDFAEPHTLQAHNGRRSLARDLMLLMAKGIDEHGTDHPILARAGKPVAVAGRARRDRESFPRVDSFGPDRNADGTERKT